MDHNDKARELRVFSDQVRAAKIPVGANEWTLEAKDLSRLAVGARATHLQMKIEEIEKEKAAMIAEIDRLYAERYN